MGFRVSKEWVLCVGCGQRPHCIASAGILDTRAVLLLSIARQRITQDDTEPGLHISKATCAAFPDPYLFGWPHRLRLKVIIEHVGASVHSGHYLTHVRQDDGTYLTYDDERVRTTNQLL